MDKQSKASFILELVQFSADVMCKSSDVIVLLEEDVQLSNNERLSKLKELFEEFLKNPEFEKEIDQLILKAIYQVDSDKIIEELIKEEKE